MRYWFPALFPLLLIACEQQEPATRPFSIGKTLGSQELTGYAQAREPRAFVFPADHGQHPEYRSEWWYVTGNLLAENDRRFGYQVTWFRFANTPQAVQRASAWGTNQTWMAHVALSDSENEIHSAEERFARGALGLAGTSLSPFRVWLDDWEITGPDGFPWHIGVATDDFELNLTLSPQKPIVLQGDRGLSRKSTRPGNASYYYSITRFATQGKIKVGNRVHEVSGLSWLDREWSTSALGPDQAGWDWFALHLDDGRDLMFYQLRRKNGVPDATSQGKLIAADGTQRALAFDEVILEPRDFWRSPAGIPYPISWRLRIPGLGEDWRIDATFPDQLMDLSVRYWEGSVDVIDNLSHDRIGTGYLEMTGYHPDHGG